MVALDDLVTAYRKAKVDIFYSSNPRRSDLVEYEENLAENLSRLLEQIEGVNEDWVADPAFVGGFTFAPKKLGDPRDDGTSFWSTPAESWRQLTQDFKPAAEFRLMARCSIDFHVLSTLWMLEVGTSLDGNLDDTAMGNRLRRGQAVAANRRACGSFMNYQVAYQRWRDGGLSAMAEALRYGKILVALTADVTSFYHRLDPSFLLDPTFIGGVLKTELSPEQSKLNRLFVAALHAWSADVAARTGWPDLGLPVGLPASAVVANLALAQLDQVIRVEVKPLYYGRYVDDILLVMEDPGGLNDQQALWKWFVARSGKLLAFETLKSLEGESPEFHQAIVFRPSYLQRSVVAFENQKNKTFFLSGPTGVAMIESIRKNIQDRHSEWRSLINVPADVGQISAKLIPTLKRDGEMAATLRDADRASARKLSFSLQLRDCESFERIFLPEQWIAQRREFFRVVCDHMLALPSFFDLAENVPRLVSLAAACHDGESRSWVVDAIALVRSDLKATCRIGVASFMSGESTSNSADNARLIVFDLWTLDLIKAVTEAIVSGWRTRISATNLSKIFSPLKAVFQSYGLAIPSAANLRTDHHRMAQRDLAHRPYRWAILRHPSADNVSPVSCDPVPLDPLLRSGLDLFVDELQRRRRSSRTIPTMLGSSNAGLVFATRPVTMVELNKAMYSSNRNSYGIADSSLVMTILEAVRGSFGTTGPDVEARPGQATILNIATTHRAKKVSVALAMLETSEANARAAAQGSPKLSVDRLDVMRKLLNSVAETRRRPDYLLLPELAMPAAWFDLFARGLMRSGISLIAGIEHQPSGRTRVTNQVWAALHLSGLNYFVYEQDKQRPASLENQLLSSVGKQLRPAKPWTSPPVVAHGNFRFAMLVCSELTNIANRAHLRGAIDALFVPEWNQDLHWFEALVEASALDLHCYVAQANTRGLGDTRMRAPRENTWERDVVRLKGGSHDYFVVGEIDIEELRIFQLTNRDIPKVKKDKTENTFKPTPDGFILAPARVPKL